ncbi:MAG: shikimate dehydrogenase [Candidatus Latescibacterota bacterium]
MITGVTRILGVLGDPIGHTSSPAMHNAAIAAMGLDYAYVAFHVRPDALGSAIEGMRALQIAGLNVTVPHKQGVMAHLDEVSDEAVAIGAVNTVVNRQGRLVGYNTDAFGILESLKRDGGLEKLPAQVALLGAGGAARAILYALLEREEVEQILLLNRTRSKAESLAGDLDRSGRVCVGQMDSSAVAEVDLLINSTSVGMYPHEEGSPLADPSVLHANMLVADIVYKPLKTRLMKQAEAAGARAINGLGMLAWQGARSFELWTGSAPPVDVMMAAALERVKDGN